MITRGIERLASLRSPCSQYNHPIFPRTHPQRYQRYFHPTDCSLPQQQQQRQQAASFGSSIGSGWWFAIPLQEELGLDDVRLRSTIPKDGESGLFAHSWKRSVEEPRWIASQRSMAKGFGRTVGRSIR